MADTASNDLAELTVALLSAFVASNSVRSDDLPALIASTHAALSGLAEPVRERRRPRFTSRQ